MGAGLFHLTLAMLRLNGLDGIEEATQLVEELQEELQEFLNKRGDKKPGKFGNHVPSLTTTIAIIIKLQVTD